MGTNYYLEVKPCGTCGRPHERLHIGKSSGGWCFSLHVDPSESINSLEDWVARWSMPDTRIVDECGSPVSQEEMLRTITKRSWPRWSWTPEDAARNHAERGPNNLARHRVGQHCVGHGDGTYDLIPGEFS